MSAVKKISQNEQSYLQQDSAVILTNQERKALSLVWQDESADNADVVRQVKTEQDLSYCAVLGYN